jgi:DHA1 family tetracycline resistance protein-like MFS transporter
MPSKSSLLILCAVIFTDMLAFSLVIPSLPFVVTQYGGTGLTLGLLFTGYSLAQFIAAPILGRLSDRIGRRPLLIAALLGTTLSLIVCALADNIWVLIGARVLGGLFGGSISVAMATLSDLSEPDKRTRVMGMGGAAIGLAFTVGPAIGALAAPLGFSAICLIGAAIAAVNFIAAIWMLPHATRRPAVAALDQKLTPGFWRLLILTGLAMVVFVGMETTLGLLVFDRFAITASGLGWLLTLAGIASIIAQAGLVWRLSARFGDWNVAAGAAVLIAVALATLPLTPFVVFLAGVCIVGAAQGALTNITASMASRLAPAGATGKYVGINQAFSALGRVVGPVLAGALYDWGPQAGYFILGALSLAAAAVALLNRGLAERKPAPADGVLNAG